MKKTLFSLAALIVMLFSSCSDNYYIEEIISEPISFTRYHTVQSEQWRLETQRNPDNSRFTYFYFDLAVPQLTDWVFDNGIMNCYLTNSSEVDHRSFVYPLPYDDFYMEDGTWMWTEQVTCEFSPRNVRFIVKYNNFNMSVAPLDYTFMIRLLW